MEFVAFQPHTKSLLSATNPIQNLLTQLGESRIDSVAYDTAWIARLAAHYQGYGFDRALEWIRRNQYPDGSWGGEFLHYHDRFICTLAAIITLYECSHHPQDAARIHQGERFLWREMGRLKFDADDTIGFPVLIVALVAEARKLGLDVPTNVSRHVEVVEQKMNYLGSDPRQWRYTSMSFSLEAARSYFPDPAKIQGSDFILGNGSVGASPAATASYLLHTKTHDESALNYLSWLVQRQNDGGAPDMNPIDVFEIGWGLLQLRIANAISPEHPVVRNLLDYLWGLWDTETGISFSQYFPLPDLDDTAVVYSLLKWGGYPVDVNVFAHYETDTHFRCYPSETNLSLSVNLRTLAALQQDRGNPTVEQWVDKICFLLRRQDLEDALWFDKWHISPYYLMPVAVASLRGVLDDLLRPRVKWVEKTQRPDGGWGYYHYSTVEETAYALQTLLLWHQHVEKVDPSVLDAAAHYIHKNYPARRLPALYIGKSLYNPVNVVASAIWGVLHSYREVR